jgi:hypothetical protein
MSRENARMLYLSVFGLILTVCVIVALGEGKKTGNNCEQIQCDTICCDSTKCDSIKCDQHVGK